MLVGTVSLVRVMCSKPLLHFSSEAVLSFEVGSQRLSLSLPWDLGLSFYIYLLEYIYINVCVCVCVCVVCVAACQMGLYIIKWVLKNYVQNIIRK